MLKLYGCLIRNEPGISMKTLSLVLIVILPMANMAGLFEGISKQSHRASPSYPGTELADRVFCFHEGERSGERPCKS